AEMGMTTYSRVLLAAPGEVAANAAKSLRDQVGARCFYLTRLRYGNDRPIGLQYTTIMTACCPDLARWDFSRESLYDVLSNHYQLTINKITHTVTALAADDVQAELLAIDVGDTLLQINTTAYLENRAVIEASVSYYRTDRYEFSITETL
ncbi:MAG: UTRA domain-containing protein, partial [Afipia sp.]|nr:UTRA domain-containing protein [Afipia sp.]